MGFGACGVRFGGWSCLGLAFRVSGVGSWGSVVRRRVQHCFFEGLLPESQDQNLTETVACGPTISYMCRAYRIWAETIVCGTRLSYVGRAYRTWANNFVYGPRLSYTGRDYRIRDLRRPGWHRAPTGGLGFGIPGSGSRVPYSSFRVPDFGFRIDSGFETCGAQVGVELAPQGFERLDPLARLRL